MPHTAPFRSSLICAWVLFSLFGFSCSHTPLVNPFAANNEHATAVAKIGSYGCGACHWIQDCPGAIGTVGPSLRQIRSRVYLAGSVPNSEDNLATWIGSPETFRHDTAMPNLGVSREDAQLIARFLRSTR